MFIINPFDRYSKTVIEPFAINTIGLSFDEKYLNYTQPLDTNNFDYISPDNKNALEVTLVATNNEFEAYTYEKELSKGKSNLKAPKIKWLRVNPDNGRIKMYYNGSFGELRKIIVNKIKMKQLKAQKRLENKHYDTVDLCLCIVEGGLFDLNSFQISFENLDISVFENIFFITRSVFVIYNKKTGFKKLPLKIARI